MQTMKTNNEFNYNITYQFLNGNNQGSVLSNKEFHVCYCVADIDIINTGFKKIVGCFINPNDLILDNDIDKNIYYFKIIMKLDKIITIKDILDNTVRLRNYSNYTTKKILFDPKNPIIKKIITKCVEVLKQHVK